MKRKDVSVAREEDRVNGGHGAQPASLESPHAAKGSERFKRARRRRITKPLGQVLLETELINQRQLEKAQAYQNVHGGLLSQILIEFGWVTEEEVALTLTTQYGFPYLPLNNYEIDDGLMQLIPEHLARTYWLIPIHRLGNALSVAMADPSNEQILEDLERLTHCVVQMFVSTPSDIQQAIERYYHDYNKKLALGLLAARHVWFGNQAALDASEETLSRIELERRMSPRMAVKLPITLSTHKVAVTAEINNLSATGTWCTIPQLFGRMTRLQVRFELAGPAHPLLVGCQGVVVRVEATTSVRESHPHFTVGVAFRNLPEQDRLAIAHYVSQCQTRVQNG
jgi:hypothetical protein